MLYKVINEDEEDRNSPPADINSIAYIIMFYQGLGNLLPWNAFITAAAYYVMRFCGSHFEDTFENYFSFSFTISQTIGLAISIAYQNRLSMHAKIVYPLLWYSSIFAVTTILVTITLPANLLFWVTMLSTTLCGLCGATLSSGVFGLAAMFPPSYTVAVMSGNGLAGVLISLSSLITTASTKPIDSCGSNDDLSSSTTVDCVEEISFSALAYFIIATLVLLSCAASYIVLQKLPFTQYYLKRSESSGSSSILTDPLLDDPSSPNPASDKASTTISSLHNGNGNSSSGSGSGNSSSSKQVDGLTSSELVTDDQAPSPSGMSLETIVRVFKVVKTPAVSVFLTFAVTIAIFPSLIVLIQSVNKCKSSARFYNDLFTPFMFLSFNIFDFCGRFSAGLIPTLFTPKTIWIPALLRVVFFPLFLLCNVSESILPLVFNHDAFPILFMFLFAFTNGYVSSTCMMFGAALSTPRDASLAGTIMIFCLTLGLFGGACTSFLVIYISQGGIH